MIHRMQPSAAKRPGPLRPALAVVFFAVLAPRLEAQVPLFVTGSGGASFDVDDRDPQTGGGLGFLAGIGVRLPRIAFGAEFGQHSLGQDRKAKQYGAFLRAPALSGGRVRPYLVAGVADYRYSPAVGNRTSALGGSIGPGLMFSLLSNQASVVLEARYHASFDRIGTISSQEFVSITLGLDLGL
jgi:hypothetical protein